jgi:hypothetical protein
LEESLAPASGKHRIVDGVAIKDVFLDSDWHKPATWAVGEENYRVLPLEVQM